MTVPLDRVPGIPALARGLATGAPDVSEFLPRAATPAAVAAQAAAVRSAFRPRSAPAGADPRLAALARGERAAVLTGQQAGLFGGPHLTLVKAVAAEKIAADLSAAGTPASAAFWCAAEDHDLVEVTRVVLPTPEGPRDFGPDPAALAANRAPVGALPIAADLDAILDGGGREPRRRARRGRPRRPADRARGSDVRRGLHADARLAARRGAPGRGRGRRRREAGARAARRPARERAARRARAPRGARRGAREGGPSAPGEDGRRPRCRFSCGWAARGCFSSRRRAGSRSRARDGAFAEEDVVARLESGDWLPVFLGAHAPARGLGPLPRRRDGARAGGGGLLGAGVAPVRMGGHRPARRPPPPLRRLRDALGAPAPREARRLSRGRPRGRRRAPPEERARARRAPSSRASRRFPSARSRSSTRPGPRSSPSTPPSRRPSRRRARSSRTPSRSSSRRRKPPRAARTPRWPSRCAGSRTSSCRTESSPSGSTRSCRTF